MSDEKTSQPINVERLRDFATSLEARIDKCIRDLNVTKEAVRSLSIGGVSEAQHSLTLDTSRIVNYTAILIRFYDSFPEAKNENTNDKLISYSRMELYHPTSRPE
ncbi:MAG TPA: hypothetical protein VJI68_03110 [Candidatus Nanoarchaeia archaeon]|nr:hypothetical protein [Candidatus Nanoarchaeia archaeon]